MMRTRKLAGDGGLAHGWNGEDRLTVLRATDSWLP